MVDTLLESRSHDFLNHPYITKLLPVLCQSLLVFASHNEPKTVLKIVENFSLKDNEALWCSSRGPRLLYLLLMSGSEESVELGKSLTDNAASFLCQKLLHLNSKSRVSINTLVGNFLKCLSAALTVHKEFLKCFVQLLTVCKDHKTHELTFHYLCANGMFDVASFFLDHLSATNTNYLLASVCDDSNKNPLYYAACSGNLNVVQLVCSAGARAELFIHHQSLLNGYLASLAQTQLVANCYYSSPSSHRHPDTNAQSKRNLIVALTKSFLPSKQFYYGSPLQSPDTQLAIVDLLLPESEQLKGLLQTRGLSLINLIASSLESKATERVMAEILPLLDTTDSLNQNSSDEDLNCFVETAMQLALPFSCRVSTEAIHLFDSLLVKLIRMCGIRFKECTDIIELYTRRGFWRLCQECVVKSNIWVESCHGRDTMSNLLVLAAKHGKCSILQSAYRNPPDRSDDWIRTLTDKLLTVAVKRNQLQVVQFLLLQNGLSLPCTLSSAVKFANKQIFDYILSHVQNSQPKLVERNMTNLFVAAARYNRGDRIVDTLVPLFMSSKKATSSKEKQYVLGSTILIEATKRGNFKLALLSIYLMPRELLRRLSYEDYFHDIVYWSCYWGMADILQYLRVTSLQLLHRTSRDFLNLNPWECAMYNGHLGKISYLVGAPRFKVAYEEYFRYRYPFEYLAGSLYDNILRGCFQSALASTPSTDQASSDNHLCSNSIPGILRSKKLIPVGMFNGYVYCGMTGLLKAYLKHLGRYAGHQVYLLTEEMMLLPELFRLCKSQSQDRAEIMEILLDALKDSKVIKKFLVSFGTVLFKHTVRGGNVRTLLALVNAGSVELYYPKGGPTDKFARATAKSHVNDPRKDLLTALLKRAVGTRKHEMFEVLLNFLKDVCLEEGVMFDDIIEKAYAIGAYDILNHTSLLEVASRSPQSASSSPSWVSEARIARGWFHSMMRSNTQLQGKEESVKVTNNFAFNLRDVSFSKLLNMAVKYRRYTVIKFLLLASGNLILSSKSVDPCVLFDPVVQQLISDCSPKFVPLSPTLSICENPEAVLNKLNTMCHTSKEIVSFVKYPGLSSPEIILNTFTSACSLGKLDVVHELVAQRACPGLVLSALDKDIVEKGMATAVATGNYDIAAYLHFECGVLFKFDHFPVAENFSELTNLIFTCTSYYSLLEKFFSSVTKSGYQLPLAAAWLAHNWTELESQFLVKQLGATSYAPSNPWSLTLTTKDGISRNVTLTIDWDSFSESLLHTPLCQSVLGKQQYTPLLVEAIVFSPAVLGQVLGFVGSDETFNQLSFSTELEQISTLIITCTAAPGLSSFKLYGEQGILTLSYLPREGLFQFPFLDSSDIYADMALSPINDSGIQSCFEASGRFSTQLESLAGDFEPAIKKALWKGTKVNVVFDEDLLHVKDNASFNHVCLEATCAVNDFIDAVKLVQTPAVLYSNIISKSNHFPKIKSITGDSPLLKEFDIHFIPPSSYYEQDKPASATRQGEVIKIEIVVSLQEEVSIDSLEQAAVCENSSETKDNSLYETLLEELTQSILEVETEATKANLEKTILRKIVPNLRHSLKTGPLDSDFVSLGLQDSAGKQLRVNDLNQDHLSDLVNLSKVAKFVSLFAKLLQIFWYKPRALKNLFQCGLKVVLSESEGTGFSDRGGHSLITLSTTDLVVKSQRDNMFNIFNLVIDAVSKRSRQKLNIEKFSPGIPAPFGCYVDYRRSHGYLFPVKNTKGSIIVQLVNYNQELLSSPPTAECELSVQIKTPSSKVIFASSSTEPHPRAASKHLMVNTGPDGEFVIEWTPLEVGVYHILVILNKVPIHRSPLKAFSSDVEARGSRQSIAGKHLVFITAHSEGRHMCRGNHTHVPIVLSKRQPIKPLCIKALQPLLEAEKENTKDGLDSGLLNTRTESYGSTRFVSHDPYGMMGVVSPDPYGFVSHDVYESTSMVSHDPYDVHEAADPTLSQRDLLKPSVSSSMEDKGSLTHHISMCSDNGGPSKWFSMPVGSVTLYISPDSNDKQGKANQKITKRFRDYFRVNCLPLSNGLSRVTVECTKACTFRVFVGCSACQSVMDTYWWDHFSKEPARCFISPGPFSVKTSSIKFVSKSQARPKDGEVVINCLISKLKFYTRIQPPELCIDTFKCP